MYVFRINIDNCTYQDIRLYGGTSDVEGMVQLCNSTGEWEAVCDYSWGCTESIVACRQLGYDRGTTTSLTQYVFSVKIML